VNRRKFLKDSALTIASVNFLSGVAQAESKHSKGDKPNIVLFFTDQQRVDTIGCYGSPMINQMTPNLDRMAADGVRFNYAFTPQPVCGPARSSLQTGKYATETGCWRNNIALKPDEMTMAKALSAGGYEVGYIGKWHLASTGGQGVKSGQESVNYETKPVPPNRRGGYKDFWLASDILEFTSSAFHGHMFDGDGNQREFPKDRYRVDVQTDWALEYLRSRKLDKPFFLMISYIEPHHQNDASHFIGPIGSKDRFKAYAAPHDLPVDKGDWQMEMPDYLGACQSLDANLGRVREELEKLGIADNTLVIYTTDHSCHFKTRNSEYKRACQDNAIRIPMIMCGPGFKGGKVIDDLVSLLDIPSTILDEAGVKQPATFRGKSLQQLVAGTAVDWRKEVFIQISESHVGRAVRTPRWTYSVRARGKNGVAVSCSDEYTEDFLYDNDRDPSQQNNLVADPEHKATRSELAEKITEYIAKVEGMAVTIKPQA
jgi:uncharacterized sulfatase